MPSGPVFRLGAGLTRQFVRLSNSLGALELSQYLVALVLGRDPITGGTLCPFGFHCGAPGGGKGQTSEYREQGERGQQ